MDRPAVFKADHPLVFAHRGGARLAPENTMAAIDNGDVEAAISRLVAKGELIGVSGSSTRNSPRTAVLKYRSGGNGA